MQKLFSNNIWIVINVIWFQIYWWLAVYLNNDAIIYLLLLLALHVAVSARKRADILFMAIAPIGIAFDIAFYQFGLYQFPQSYTLLPLWLALLWPAFFITLNHSLAWMFRLPLWLCSIISAFGGSSSYYFAYKMEAVTFPYGTIKTTLLIALFWALLIPVMAIIMKRKNKTV